MSGSAADGKDEELPSAERARLQEGYATQALNCLRRAVAKGFGSVNRFQKYPDLEAVRGRADLERHVREREAKANTP
jgi:hypothetical protein